MRKRKNGFTLVELLVVIGIIALLISILLPALSKARDAANTVKCAANLHAIGAGFANYIVNYKGVLPASNVFRPNPGTGDAQTQPNFGYIHWSSFIYNDSYAAQPPYQVFRSLAGWGMFQCPALPNGGLAPADTYAGNNDPGLPNDAGPDVVDFQAPRLAYTVNEALCPRGYFSAGVYGTIDVTIPYHYVQAARIRNSGGVILATELGGSSDAATTTGLISGNPSSNSRRPVNGVLAAGFPADKPMTRLSPGNWIWARASSLHTNPQQQLAIGSAVNTTLDYVGRNHGSYKLGTVASFTNDTRTNWDLRKSNFLYLDGHVETKHITETLKGNGEWGDQFYTLDN
jgi:prepilin-type N-terminal cleavage/methylation domain-containing protein/prepilin-type processing-associated H-X9-DG protein